MPPIPTHKPGAVKVPPGIVIFGRTGVGKSTLLGTMPGQGILIDVRQHEGGDFVLEDVADNITVIPISTWDELDRIYWAIQKKDRNELPTVDFSKLLWVALDSATGAQRLAKAKIVKDRPLNVNPAKVSQQEWGDIGNLMIEMVTKLRGLPYMTVFTAQERKHGGGDDGAPVMFGPDVSPAALSGLLPPMTLVGRLWVDSEGKRLLRVAPHTMYTTKFRTTPTKAQKMPAVIAEPNLSRILRFMLADGRPPKAAQMSTVILE